VVLINRGEPVTWQGPKDLHYAVGGGLLTLPQKVLMEVLLKFRGAGGLQLNQQKWDSD
jgi:hypothetical protein